MTESTPRSGAMRFATRGHHRLAYEVVVPDGTKDAPVLVLLHGLLGERGDFALMRGMLRQVARPPRLVIPDARGHGASAALANLTYSLADMVAELAAILDAEGIDQAHLAGHDLGGATAFGFARAHPERVRSLTLIEPALGCLLDQALDPAARSARAVSREADRAAADAAYKGMADAALDRYLNPRRGPAWRDELTKPRLAALRRNVGALGGTLTALDGASLTADLLTALDVPIRVTYRDNAPDLTRRIGCHLEAVLTAATVTRLPAAESPLVGEAGAMVGKMLAEVVSTPIERG